MTRLAAAALIVVAPACLQILAQHRPEPRMPTITTLPEFPNVPTSGAGLSPKQKDEAIQTLVDHKVATYPAISSRGRRPGKFTSPWLSTFRVVVRVRLVIGSIRRAA